MLLIHYPYGTRRLVSSELYWGGAPEARTENDTMRGRATSDRKGRDGVNPVTPTHSVGRNEICREGSCALPWSPVAIVMAEDHVLIGSDRFPGSCMSSSVGGSDGGAQDPSLRDVPPSRIDPFVGI